MFKTIVAIGFISLATSFNLYAQDSNRITQLEKEIQELKDRVSKLETLLGNQSSSQQPLASDDGWKSITNWRRLATNMSTSDVRKVLGEPQRINGGGVALWYYSNGGRVTFIDDRLSSWTEPRP